MAEGEKYGLLFCNEALLPSLEEKNKQYLVMSNVNPSDELKTIAIRYIEPLPREYIGKKNRELEFLEFSCDDLPE